MASIKIEQDPRKVVGATLSTKTQRVKRYGQTGQQGRTYYEMVEFPSLVRTDLGGGAYTLTEYDWKFGKPAVTKQQTFAGSDLLLETDYESRRGSGSVRPSTRTFVASTGERVTEKYSFGDDLRQKTVIVDGKKAGTETFVKRGAPSVFEQTGMTPSQLRPGQVLVTQDRATGARLEREYEQAFFMRAYAREAETIKAKYGIDAYGADPKLFQMLSQAEDRDFNKFVKSDQVEWGMSLATGGSVLIRAPTSSEQAQQDAWNRTNFLLSQQFKAVSAIQEYRQNERSNTGGDSGMGGDFRRFLGVPIPNPPSFKETAGIAIGGPAGLLAVSPRARSVVKGPAKEVGRMAKLWGEGTLELLRFDIPEAYSKAYTPVPDAFSLLVKIDSALPEKKGLYFGDKFVEAKPRVFSATGTVQNVVRSIVPSFKGEYSSPQEVWTEGKLVSSYPGKEIRARVDAAQVYGLLSEVRQRRITELKAQERLDTAGYMTPTKQLSIFGDTRTAQLDTGKISFMESSPLRFEQESEARAFAVATIGLYPTAKVLVTSLAGRTVLTGAGVGATVPSVQDYIKEPSYEGLGEIALYALPAGYETTRLPRQFVEAGTAGLYKYAPGTYRAAAETRLFGRQIAKMPIPATEIASAETLRTNRLVKVRSEAELFGGFEKTRPMTSELLGEAGSIKLVSARTGGFTPESRAIFKYGPKQGYAAEDFAILEVMTPEGKKFVPISAGKPGMVVETYPGLASEAEYQKLAAQGWPKQGEFMNVKLSRKFDDPGQYFAPYGDASTYFLRLQKSTDYSGFSIIPSFGIKNQPVLEVATDVKKIAVAPEYLYRTPGPSRYGPGVLDKFPKGITKEQYELVVEEWSRSLKYGGESFYPKRSFGAFNEVPEIARQPFTTEPQTLLVSGTVKYIPTDATTWLGRLAFQGKTDFYTFISNRIVPIEKSRVLGFQNLRIGYAPTQGVAVAGGDSFGQSPSFRQTSSGMLEYKPSPATNALVERAAFDITETVGSRIKIVGSEGFGVPQRYSVQPALFSYGRSPKTASVASMPSGSYFLTQSSGKQEVLEYYAPRVKGYGSRLLAGYDFKPYAYDGGSVTQTTTTPYNVPYTPPRSSTYYTPYTPTYDAPYRPMRVPPPRKPPRKLDLDLDLFRRGTSARRLARRTKYIPTLVGLEFGFKARKGARKEIGFTGLEARGV